VWQVAPTRRRHHHIFGTNQIDEGERERVGKNTDGMKEREREKTKRLEK
jgi:hypothetical protein